MVLTTEALVEKPEKSRRCPDMGGMGGMGDGWHGRHGRHGHGHDVVRAHAPTVVIRVLISIESPYQKIRLLAGGYILLSLKCSTLSCANRMVKNTSALLDP